MVFDFMPTKRRSNSAFPQIYKRNTPEGGSYQLTAEIVSSYRRGGYKPKMRKWTHFTVR